MPNTCVCKYNGRRIDVFLNERNTMQTAKTQPFAVMIVAILITASPAAEQQASGPSNELLRVKAETTLFAFNNGALRPIVQLPANTDLMPIEEPEAVAAPNHFIYVSFTHPTAGGPLLGWIDTRSNFETARLTQDACSNVSRLNKATGQQRSQQGSGEVFNDEIPGLVRINGVEELWREIQLIMAEAKETGKKLPEPYKARADLWSKLHIHDEALKDYVTAAELALAAAPDGDLATNTRLFKQLFDAIKLHNNVPKPPGPGAAIEYYGAGIRAYRNGEFKYAAKLFSDALQLDDSNAVYYYYRALSKKRLGENPAAARDARTGSYYEWRLPFRSRRHITANLAAVQGEFRIWLESYRLGDPHFDPRRNKPKLNVGPKQNALQHVP